MQVTVLGSGCASCCVLEARTVEALRQLGLDQPVHKMADDASIAHYGVEALPALIVDDRVVFSGCLPDIPELKWTLSQLAVASG
jgi:hypothetical protein